MRQTRIKTGFAYTTSYEEMVEQHGPSKSHHHPAVR